MTLGITLGYDATRVNASHVPTHSPTGRPIQVAGYDTGSGDVPWTADLYGMYVSPLHICQKAGPGNPSTSDYIDVERFAATNQDAAEWYPRARLSYLHADRPGQRWPSVYTSASNVPALIAQFREAGIEKGPGLIIANWSITDDQTEQEVLDHAGDAFPVHGGQFASGQFYDADIYLTEWLDRVSAKVPAIFWHPSAPGDTFAKIAKARDANLDNLVLRTVNHSSAMNLARIGEALLMTDTEYATVNP